MGAPMERLQFTTEDENPYNLKQRHRFILC